MATSDKPRRDLSTPDIPASSATLSVYASTRINASASLVFRTIRNTDTWKDWCRWIPKVVITYQPPDEDHATAAEIQQLVRNTSIAGSIDSDITDGAAGGPIVPPKNVGNLGVTLQRQRLLSNASQPSRTGSTSSSTNGLSGAQKFAASRKASTASGVSIDAKTPPATGNVLVESPTDPSVLFPAPPNTAGTAAATRKRGSISAPQRRALSINALYGEPSIRLQVQTRMTFHMRMKMPSSYALDKESAMVVTEVSRPDDDETDFPGLVPVSTHTLSRGGVYRIVWSVVNTAKTPKFMLQAQRVIEIRPVVRGDGKDECVYEDWELQRGVLAKGVKKASGPYVQTRFEEWGRGLKEFAETMGGAVERRDFIDETLRSSSVVST